MTSLRAHVKNVSSKCCTRKWRGYSYLQTLIIFSHLATVSLTFIILLYDLFEMEANQVENNPIDDNAAEIDTKV